ncbi:MAG: acetate--CoA ligase [Francisellaceae bacterium]|jgi:acetyl-CoA synthetase|nr:acetate--CoA ligase [Francisellaceae bacterium]MBT6206983.1 acetate--CoA ligase [Francisellaceae bacterium]MBT6538180.1 acetate--CoA ligase [Francisellaceae bacterium]
MEKSNKELLSNCIDNPHDTDSYNKVHSYSISNTEKFWEHQSKSQLYWEKEFTSTFNGDLSQGTDRWFDDGCLNACYNCLDRHAQTHPEKLAIIWSSESKTETRYITYKRLHEQVSLFSNSLKNLSCEPGDTVCIYMPMIPEAIIAMLACARIGVTHSVVFAGFSPEALSARIIDANAKVLITADQTTRSGKLINLKEQADIAVKDHNIEHMIVVKRTGNTINWVDGRDQWYNELLSESESDCPVVNVDSNYPLFMLYTSGSTGKPKGIVHSTGGYLSYVTSTFKSVFNYQDKDVYWCTADIGWITGHSYLVYGPLSAGATIFMLEGNPMYPSANELSLTIDEHKISILYTAPTLIRMLMRHGDDAIQGSTRESIRLLGTVGEPINPAAWEWYKEKIGNNKAPIVDTWWQTETGGIMISPHVNGKQKPGAAMSPCWGIKPYILDEKGSEKQGENTSGCLVIKNSWPGKMLTIHNDHQRYLDTYLSKYPGYYFCGDGARRDNDGDLWITGRIDDVINVAGHRLSTEEIESVLVSHRSISEAAVVSVPDQIKGEAIYAFVQVMKDVIATDQLKKELENHVKKSIGSFAKPKHIQMVAELPKTRSGKIMRRVLKKLILKQHDQLGDLSTLAESSTVKDIISSLEPTN